MSERELAADLSGLPESGQVVVGFSGGVDSTALSHCLARLLGPERLVLAHVNHLLRGEEAERDEAHARSFAEGLGLRFVVFRSDVRAEAEKRRLGLEECGRLLRYGFLESLATGENDRILTAHTADDNAETLLLHLCRGSGLSGLAGIPPQRGKILRPLLGVTRAQIEAYCRAYGLSYVEDSSNRSPDFARNRVRHEVLPVLRELNPRAVEAMGRAALLLARDAACLEEEAAALLQRARRNSGLDTGTLLAAPEALTTRALQRWLREQGCPQPELRHIQAACALLRGNGRAVPLPGGITLRRRRGLLWTAATETGEK